PALPDRTTGPLPGKTLHREQPLTPQGCTARNFERAARGTVFLFGFHLWPRTAKVTVRRNSQPRLPVTTGACTLTSACSLFKPCAPSQCARLFSFLGCHIRTARTPDRISLKTDKTAH